jgi:hypothetical protein
MRALEGPQSTMPISSETRVYVVFDRATGEVVHVHETVIFPNTRKAAKAPMRGRCVWRARRGRKILMLSRLIRPRSGSVTGSESIR